MAICGFGLVGQRHAEAAKAVPGVTVSAVVEPSEAGRATAATQGLACHMSLDALFAAGPIDGLIVATPTPLHVDNTLDAIARGCPVLVEKPLATHVEAARAIVSASAQRSVPVLVGHHRRHNPIIQAAHDVISRGRIGDVRAVNALCWFYKPDAYFDVAPWRKETGAGPVSVNLVHDIDLIRYLCGDVASVSAQAAPSARGYANEDVAAAVLTLATGAIATITVSDSIVAPWSWEMTSREYPIYPQTDESCYMIGGSEGGLSLPDLRVWTHKNGQRDWWTPIAAHPIERGMSDPLVNQISHFRDVIADGASPLVPAEEGLRTLRVIEAIQTSAATGQPIHLGAMEESANAAE
nr:Gfo/Idh/MocA family oxidoreductase [Hasllibacter sp. MH4015]